MSEKNIIEINGRNYDAATGKAIVAGQRPSPATMPGTIDGFHRRQPLQAATPNLKPAVKHPVTERAINHLQPAPQRTKTLLRTAVRKPANPIHAVQTAPKAAAATQQPADRPLFVPPARIDRAKQTQRSQLIQRFSNGVSSPGTAPVVKRQEHMPVHPAPAPTRASLPASQPEPRNSTHLFEQAVNVAHAHEQARIPHAAHSRRPRLKPKLVAAVSTAMIVLAIGGFIAYQNVPSLAMRVAANRAGFEAEMPGYKPSGFAYQGPISYNKGIVSIDFKSTTDQRHFKLTQRPSDWTSDSLLSNYVSKQSDKYQTYRDKGLTLYVYDGSNATWVDKGIWYSLTGKSQLSSEQILSVASSL